MRGSNQRLWLRCFAARSSDFGLDLRLEPSRKVARIREALPVLTGALPDRISETEAAVGEKAPLDFLQDLENEWRSRQNSSFHA